MPDPAGGVLEALAAAFRGRPGFLAPVVRRACAPSGSATPPGPTREAIAASVERILAVHWPRASARDRAAAARMVVVAGDGLLREAFRTSRRGDDQLPGREPGDARRLRARAAGRRQA